MSLGMGGEGADNLQSETTSWRRVDCTCGCYKPLGKLILDGGGWQDLESLPAAQTLASKCLTLWNCPLSVRRPSRKRGRNVAAQARMPPRRLRLLEVLKLARKHRRPVWGAMWLPYRC